MSDRVLDDAARCPVKTPFTVLIDSDNQQLQVTCKHVLRYLPGKRLVCAGEFNGQEVIVKFFINKKKARKNCLREELGISALQKASIFSPKILFKGVTCPENQPALLIQKIEGGEDFKHVWQKAEDENRQKKLMSKLALVVADLHEAGLNQRDMHLGNFMVAGDDIYTIDGGALKFGQKKRPLSQSQSIKNLAAILAQFPFQVDHLFPHVFKEYQVKRAWPEDKELNDRLTKRVNIERQKRVQKYLKKIYRESTAYVCRRSVSSFWVCSRPDLTQGMRGFLQDPDEFMISGQLLKNGNSSTVALVEVDGRQLVVKRYNIKNAMHGIKRAIRPSRAWISWRNAHYLRLIGVSTPKPIAFLEKRIGPLRSTAYFITELISGMNAYQWFHSENTDLKLQQDIIEKFGQLFRKFYKFSIVHGDFKATNFIIFERQIIVTDLDAMSIYKRKSKRFLDCFKKDCKRFKKNWIHMHKAYEMSVHVCKDIVIRENNI